MTQKFAMREIFNWVWVSKSVSSMSSKDEIDWAKFDFQKFELYSRLWVCDQESFWLSKDELDAKIKNLIEISKRSFWTMQMKFYLKQLKLCDHEVLWLIDWRAT